MKFLCFDKFLREFRNQLWKSTLTEKDKNIWKKKFSTGLGYIFWDFIYIYVCVCLNYIPLVLRLNIKYMIAYNVLSTLYLVLIMY